MGIAVGGLAYSMSPATVLAHRSDPLALRPLAQVAVARVDRAARVARASEGDNGCPSANGSPFYPTILPPRLYSDFKGDSKARCSSPTGSSSVAIPNAQNVDRVSRRCAGTGP